MIFGRSQIQQRCRGRATNFSTCRVLSSLLLGCSTALLLLGLIGRESMCQKVPLSLNQQTRNTLSNTGLNFLKKQHESGPSWLDMAKARGFIGEKYLISSRDNTPLAVYHLINPLANPRTLNKYPVLVHHGLASDAAQMLSHSDSSGPRAPVVGKFIADPTDTALAFMLSNNNFDVWMCDARGTNLDNHLVSDDFNLLQAQKFWNFSLDEQVHHDLPAIIDFVLLQTFENKVHYISFSESTYMMFALLSSEVAYQDKIASFTALSPVAYLTHVSGLALALLSPAGLVPDSINGNFVPQIFLDTMTSATRQMCQNILSTTFCPQLTSALSGKGDNTISTMFYATTLKSTSIKAIKHFLQQLTHRRMSMYDYGREGNMRQYGQPAAPLYNLGNIKLPSIILIRGGHDFLSTHPDQQRLLAELGAQPYVDLYYPDYNHVDTLIGRNIVEEVNLPAMRAIFEWTREWAHRAGLTTILQNPAKANLKKPVAPVAVVMPGKSRTLIANSNLMKNIIDSALETTVNRKLENNDGGKTLSVPLSVNLQNPLTALTSSLSSALPLLG